MSAKRVPICVISLRNSNNRKPRVGGAKQANPIRRVPTGTTPFGCGGSRFSLSARLAVSASLDGDLRSTGLLLPNMLVIAGNMEVRVHMMLLLYGQIMISSSELDMAITSASCMVTSFP